MHAWFVVCPLPSVTDSFGQIDSIIWEGLVEVTDRLSRVIGLFRHVKLTNRRQCSMVYTVLLKTASLYNAIRGI